MKPTWSQHSQSIQTRFTWTLPTISSSFAVIVILFFFHSIVVTLYSNTTSLVWPDHEFTGPKPTYHVKKDYNQPTSQCDWFATPRTFRSLVHSPFLRSANAPTHFLAILFKRLNYLKNPNYSIGGLFCAASTTLALKSIHLRYFCQVKSVQQKYNMVIER